MEITYNTELAVRSVGVKLPPGEKAPADTNCMYCGRPIVTGGPCEKVKIGRGSFMDDAWFATRSGIACLNCVAMTDSAVAKKMGSANCIVYGEDGALPIAKDAFRTWFLLTPPKPPFVVTASATINYQHVVWKVPVTYSHDMIYIAWPTRIMTIRHKVLMKAVEMCRFLADSVVKAKEDAAVLAQADKKKKTKKIIKPMSHPYICLDRDLSDLNHGVLRPDVLDLAKTDGAVAEAVQFLQGLSLGETWGLATLVKSKPELPVKPEALYINPNVLLEQK